jgi:hypothetical protein
VESVGFDGFTGLSVTHLPFDMGLKPRRANQKNPPFFSHDFIIVNHADIVSCIAMVFVVGLMFQVGLRNHAAYGIPRSFA